MSKKPTPAINRTSARTISRPDGRLLSITARLTHPAGTGYVKDLYTIKDAPPHIKDLFETSFLSVADNQAAEALRVMVHDNAVPADGLKFAWARFMMSLLYRTGSRT